MLKDAQASQIMGSTFGLLCAAAFLCSCVHTNCGPTDSDSAVSASPAAPLSLGSDTLSTCEYAQTSFDCNYFTAARSHARCQSRHEKQADLCLTIFTRGRDYNPDRSGTRYEQ